MTEMDTHWSSSLWSSAQSPRVSSHPPPPLHLGSSHIAFCPPPLSVHTLKLASWKMNRRRRYVSRRPPEPLMHTPRRMRSACVEVLRIRATNEDSGFIISYSSCSSAPESLNTPSWNTKPETAETRLPLSPSDSLRSGCELLMIRTCAVRGNEAHSCDKTHQTGPIQTHLRLNVHLWCWNR